MPDPLLRAQASAWTRVVRDLNADSSDRIGIYGHDADRVAAALRSVRPQALIASGDAAPMGDGGDGLADLGLVVLLHAWRPVRRVDAIARSVAGRLSPGTVLALADLDVPRLVRGAGSLYPSGAMYRQHPEIGDWLTARSAAPAQLDTAAIRAAMTKVRGAVVDLPVAVHDHPEAFRAHVAGGQWRGFDQLTPEQRDGLVAGLDIPAGAWPRTEVEPWYVVAATVRDWNA